MRRLLAAAALSLLAVTPCAHAAVQPAWPRAAVQPASPRAAVQPAPQSSPETPLLAHSALDDATITRKAADAIHADPRLAGADISVNTDHGVVNLTGSVQSREQAVVASERAQTPDGVMRIEDHLSVTPP